MLTRQIKYNLQLTYLHNRSYTKNFMLIKVNKLKLIKLNPENYTGCSPVNYTPVDCTGLLPQPAFTCPKLTIETLEQDVNMFKINNKNTRTTLVSLLLTLNIFHTLFQCFCC